MSRDITWAKIKVFTMKDEFVGYLSCSTDWTTQMAQISDLDRAYNYKFTEVNGGLRLDQQTDGGDRSLTYSSNGFYPCWGLGPNWVVVAHGTDQAISFVNQDTTYYLARGRFSPGGPTWGKDLLWMSDAQIGPGTDFQKLKFSFDKG